MIKYKIPTGYLFVDDYEKGKLETLSIGDYGKAQNVKADFLGYILLCGLDYHEETSIIFLYYIIKYDENNEMHNKHIKYIIEKFDYPNVTLNK